MSFPRFFLALYYSSCILLRSVNYFISFLEPPFCTLPFFSFCPPELDLRVTYRQDSLQQIYCRWMTANFEFSSLQKLSVLSNASNNNKFLLISHQSFSWQSCFISYEYLTFSLINSCCPNVDIFTSVNCLLSLS